MELEKNWLYDTVLKIPFFTQEIFSKRYDDFCETFRIFLGNLLSIGRSK